MTTLYSVVAVSLFLGIELVRGFSAPKLNPPKQFTQLVDHFDSSNSATWIQRYAYNDSHFGDKTGPVFVLIDGEEPINFKWEISGHHIEMAEKFGALVFVVEHRYYGLSDPTDKLDLAGLKYLTSEQAIADIANLVKGLQSEFKYDITKNKVITFGGSYAGSLSAWMRTKYPDVVYASVASSAPVLAQDNFYEYNQLLAEAYARKDIGGSAECEQRIRDSFAQLSESISSSDTSNIDKILDKFGICPGGRGYTELDKSRFVESVAQFFQVAVQYNGQDGVTISDLCEKMLKNQSATALDTLTKVHSEVSPSFFGCVNSTFATTVSQFEYLDSRQFRFERQWKFQTCNEFGYYQTCDFPQDSEKSCIFGPYLNLNYYTALCTQLFQISPSDLSDKVASTNKFYGGKNPAASRILFVNGDVDPWRALSVVDDLQNDVTTIVIPGASHFQNMFSSSSSDSSDMKNGRSKIEAKVASWVQSNAMYALD